jgi:hypothetical protein
MVIIITITIIVMTIGIGSRAVKVQIQIIGVIEMRGVVEMVEDSFAHFS